MADKMSIHDRLFENIVADLEIDQNAYDFEMSQVAPPLRTYVIVFMARSGSSWLTSLLSGTGLLGHPEEYINPGFVRAVATSLNSRDQAGFLKILQRRRKTPNGVFGLEAREFDIDHFGKQTFFEAFDTETLFFNLWRNNIVSQAISLYRAMVTGRWHCYESDVALTVPDYDSAEIKRFTVQLLNEENANLTMLMEQGMPVRSICYETIVNDRAGTLKLFADALGVELTPEHYGLPKEGEHTKIGDVWNDEVEHRFRAEHPAFIRQTERLRLIKVPLAVHASSHIGTPKTSDAATQRTDAGPQRLDLT